MDNESPGTTRRRHSPSKIADGARMAANKPEPRQAWRKIVWRFIEQFSDHRILSVAAGVAFYTLLAIFPGIGALISLYGLFADPASVSSHLAFLAGLLPGGAVDIIHDQIIRLAAQPPASLGFGFFLGLGVALWSASAGMKALFDAMNVVYGQKETRGFVKLSALALLFTLGGLALLIAALGAVVALPIIFNVVGLGGLSEILMRILRWPILFALTALSLEVLYRHGPDHQKATAPQGAWGSVLAALLWVAASVMFSWYVQNFGSYNRTYGSLGAVIGFMTWIWLSATIFLLGAELNAESGRRKIARDPTTAEGIKGGAKGAALTRVLRPRRERR